MNTHKLLIAAALSACSCSVFAQWQWVDETGRKVFSDRPPPTHITPKQILKQPAGAVAPSQQVRYPSAENAAPTPLPSAAAHPIEKAPDPAQTAQAQHAAEAAAHDKAVEEAQRKAEEAERQKQEAKVAKQRQENCQRAKAAHASLQSGGLMAHVNEKGERGLMTEPQRQADLQRAQQIIKDNCK